jgi:catechol 2,3-dioxygenase-like lactoylglutathione lyase family enzyme
MIDHTSIAVRDYPKSLAFYDATLSTLGYERLITIDISEVKLAGYGTATRPRPSFWISPMGKQEEEVGNARGVHMAFIAPSVSAVHEWYQTCLEYGGASNGEPGPRPEYHPGYYGSFVIDPNGWRIEACFHEYEGP